MTLPPRAQAVLDTWTAIGPEGWYAGGEALDADIRAHFLPDWEGARRGACRDWAGSAQGCLAYLILTDQFPRNMFRGQAEAFATDALAREVAARAVQHGLDTQIEGDLRQFFYLPMMHSETLVDQHRCVALFAARMPGDNLLHARAHREVIRRFARFPFRNAALGRVSTPAEEDFLAEGGYAAILRALG